MHMLASVDGHVAGSSPVIVQVNSCHRVPEIRARLLAAQRLQGEQLIGPLDCQQHRTTAILLPVLGGTWSAHGQSNSTKNLMGRIWPPSRSLPMPNTAPWLSDISCYLPRWFPPPEREEQEPGGPNSLRTHTNTHTHRFCWDVCFCGVFFVFLP